MNLIINYLIIGKVSIKTSVDLFFVNDFLFVCRCTMIRLRHEHKLCLKSDNLDFFYEDSIKQLFAYHRYDNEQTDHILVIINWSGEIIKNYQVKDIPIKGQWMEYLTKTIINVNDDNILTLDIEGQQGKIFILNRE